jgi:hypothetical protein
LAGCQGELVNEEFDVYMEDSKGNVIVDETLTSGANGFIDLWLPRDEKFVTKIQYAGKTVESEIYTYEKDPTCITTMQLQ